MASALSIDVIIPARDATRTIGACLRALRQEGVPSAVHHLIVVDDGSRDDTARIAEEHGATVLHSGGRGPAAARNVGLRASTTQVIAFLDADTEPRSGWLQALTRPFADPGIVAVKGRYHSRQRELIARYAQLEFVEKYERLASAPSVDFVDTGTAAFRRDSLNAIGGFDESFREPSAEDVDLGYRLQASGGRLAFAPNAGVWHQHPTSLLAFLHRKARYGRYRAAVYRAFPRKAVSDSYTPRLTRPRILLAAIVLVLIPVATIVAEVRAVALFALFLHGATTVAIAARTWKSDRPLALAAPGIALATSVAQVIGLGMGLVDLLRKRGARAP
ncbi:MAG: glycosyltransferase [Chloroflexota bacterium]|nr:MAG: glycosyltransferase [Chloroflexota bacterium]